MNADKPKGLKEALETANEVVESVLAKHGIDTRRIAYLLGVTIDDVCYPDDFDGMHRAEYMERGKRIMALEKVLALYRTHEPGLAPIRLSERIAVIEDLLGAEQQMQDAAPPPKKPRNRPVSAKNAGAEAIFDILIAQGVNTWDACSLIAEMFILADIEDRPHDNVLRSFYDKLSRLVR